MSTTRLDIRLDESVKQRAEKAARHMKVGVSRTMVLPANERRGDGKRPIAAFYTIAPRSVERERLPRYPVPVFLIAQLAVDRKAHGHGV